MMIRALLESTQQLDLFDQSTASSIESHWPVRVSRRAKHLRINILPNGQVEVVVPPRCKPNEIEAFVSENRRWVNRQLRKLGPIERELPLQIELAAIKQSVSVEYRIDNDLSWRCQDGQLWITGAASEHHRALQDWLKQWARQELSAMVEQHAQETGLAFQRLQWRIQKTRWGSCSSNRTISLNAAILLLNPELARYVVLHELCHLKYMSHGPRFWGLLSKHCGEDAKILDRQLNGFSLGTKVWLYR